MITSVQNAKVKHWNKLKKRKEREASQQFFIEGHHLVQEAFQSDWHVQEVILEEGTDRPDWLHSSATITYVSDNVFKSITDTRTPQGIAAIVGMQKPTWVDFKKILLIDAIQDPGNLGTIIRTADAAGFEGVVLGEGTVDLYNDKVIRATQGSIFHIAIFHNNLLDFVPTLKTEGYQVWASTLEGAVPFHQVAIPEKVALILGNEGSGIEESLVEYSSERVNIPIYGQAESLNVSVAAGVLIYYVANGSR
ncbi:TrmH family RNA methyltransferase [Aquibacillus kalidii]|uniref:TrmH family RNA methyltransferase n=1 Tax=Aquibacillus kalidii TaxID=2762597 RepID=UPI0016463424|nr:RNA methyltransferase [Aquibacillus kalidii]